MVTKVKITQPEMNELGITLWPVWEKEVSRFPWTYDEEEVCYFLEGEVVVEYEGGFVEIGPGDYVTFLKGLECIWDIRKPVRKHYSFR